MNFPKSPQPRPSSPSSSYIPPHRTQLHPRMISLYSSSSPNPNPNNKPHTTRCLLFFFALLFFTAPFLFYLFSTALQIHSSPKFADSRPASFALALRAGPHALRLSVFHFLGPARALLAAAHSAAASPGFDAGPDALRGTVAELIKFAKGRVPRREWGNTVVRLDATEEVEGLGVKEAEKVLECFRQALRVSGFLFKDEWARVISGEEQGISSWVAVNYALGNLGREAQETTGIVELGGASLQVTSAKLNADLAQSLRTIRLSGVTYNLYTQSWPQLASKSSKRNIINPCIPRGYEYPQITNASDVKHPIFQPAGNFSACRSKAILRMAPRTSLFQLEAEGRHYCEDHWDALKDLHNEVDYMDLLKYCFSSAYMLALLHDVLGIAMEEKRVGFGNRKINSDVDWTLGSFITETMAEPLELEHLDTGMIVGNESVTYFSLFAFLFLFMLAAFFVLQWRKPQLKTVYDLEKGRYIVTRIPR
ncbi:putative apyrase 6 [Glycine max]|nr:putative apyrase 6 [Glycine max]